MLKKLVVLVVLLGGIPLFVYAHEGAAGNIGQIANPALIHSHSDQISQITDQLRPQAGHSLAELTQLAQDRKNLMLELAQESPSEFLRLALKKSERDALPAPIQNDLEHETTVTGKLLARHTDDFLNPANSLATYFLQTGTENLSVFTAGSTPLPGISGAQLKISGVQIANAIVTPDTTNTVQVMQAAPAAAAVGTQRLAIILVRYTDSPATTLTPTEAANEILTGPVNDFYQETSYNQTSLTGDVMGWYTLPQTGGSCSAISPAWPTETDVLGLMTSHGFDPNNYDRVVALTNNCTQSGWSYVGKISTTYQTTTYTYSSSRVGVQNYSTPWTYWKTQPYPWTTLEYITSHELGHALGVWHANNVDCPAGDVSYSSQTIPCEHTEYGNAYDVMGTGSYGMEFNALYKDALGWLNPTLKTNISQEGITHVTLNPYSDGNLNLKAVTIQPINKTAPIFSLEHRTAAGFDSILSDPDLAANQAGVFVNKLLTSGFANSGSNYSMLLDNSPLYNPHVNTPVDLSQVSLNPGQVFQDPGLGVTISVDPPTGDSTVGLTVDLEQPTCARHRPQAYNLAATGGTLPINANQTYSGNFSIYNEDSASCGSSQFQTVVSAPADWIVSASNPSFLMAPESTFAGSYSVQAPATLQNGTYVVTVSLLNTFDGSVVELNRTTYLKNLPTITSLNPTSGYAGTAISVTGSGFWSGTNNWVCFSGSDCVLAQYNSPTSLTVIVPATIPVGSHAVIAYNAYFGYGAWFNSFTVLGNDTTAPVTSITTPTAGAVLYGNTTLTASATDDIGVTKVEFYANNLLLGQTATAPYSFVWNTTTVPDGNYSLLAKAYDAAGNVGTSAAVATTVTNLDTTAPTVSITAPTNGTIVSGIATVSATAADNVGVVGVQFLLDGANLGVESLTSPYAISWDTTTASNGSHNLTAVARDAAGNKSTSAVISLSVSNGSTRTFGNNTIGSSVDSGDSNFMNAVKFTTPNQGGATISMSVYIASPVGVAPNNQFQVAVYSDAAGSPGSLVASSVAQTIIADNWNTVSLSAASLTANTVYWLAYNTNGTDQTQNNLKTAAGTSGQMVWRASFFGSWPATFGAISGLSSTTASIYVTYATVADTTAPAVSLTAPTGGSVVSGTVSVSATAADNVGVAGVQFKLDGVNLGAEDTTSPYSVSWNTTTTANGSHNLTAVARDAAGNITTSAVVAVTVSNSDTIAPTTSITSPLNASKVSKNTNVTISATASDNVGVTSVRFYVGSTLTCTDTAAPYSCVWKVPNTTGVQYKLQTKAYDAAGNIGSSTIITVTSK